MSASRVGVSLFVLTVILILTPFTFAHAGKAADAMCPASDDTHKYNPSHTYPQIYEENKKEIQSLWRKPCSDNFVKGFCTTSDFCDAQQSGSQCESNGAWLSCAKLSAQALQAATQENPTSQTPSTSGASGAADSTTGSASGAAPTSGSGSSATPAVPAEGTTPAAASEGSGSSGNTLPTNQTTDTNGSILKQMMDNGLNSFDATPMSQQQPTAPSGVAVGQELQSFNQPSQPDGVLGRLESGIQNIFSPELSNPTGIQSPEGTPANSFTPTNQTPQEAVNQASTFSQGEDTAPSADASKSSWLDNAWQTVKDYAAAVGVNVGNAISDLLSPSAADAKGAPLDPQSPISGDASYYTCGSGGDSGSCTGTHNNTISSTGNTLASAYPDNTVVVACDSGGTCRAAVSNDTGKFLGNPEYSGGNRVADLTSTLFKQFAPLDQGVIHGLTLNPVGQYGDFQSAQAAASQLNSIYAGGSTGYAMSAQDVYSSVYASLSPNELSQMFDTPRETLNVPSGGNPPSVAGAGIPASGWAETSVQSAPEFTAAEPLAPEPQAEPVANVPSAGVVEKTDIPPVSDVSNGVPQPEPAPMNIPSQNQMVDQLLQEQTGTPQPAEVTIPTQTEMAQQLQLADRLAQADTETSAAALRAAVDAEQLSGSQAGVVVSNPLEPFAPIPEPTPGSYVTAQDAQALINASAQAEPAPYDWNSFASGWENSAAISAQQNADIAAEQAFNAQPSAADFAGQAVADQNTALNEAQRIANQLGTFGNELAPVNSQLFSEFGQTPPAPLNPNVFSEFGQTPTLALNAQQTAEFAQTPTPSLTPEQTAEFGQVPTQALSAGQTAEFGQVPTQPLTAAQTAEFGQTPTTPLTSEQTAEFGQTPSQTLSSQQSVEFGQTPTQPLSAGQLAEFGQIPSVPLNPEIFSEFGQTPTPSLSAEQTAEFGQVPSAPENTQPATEVASNEPPPAAQPPTEGELQDLAARCSSGDAAACAAGNYTPPPPPSASQTAAIQPPPADFARNYYELGDKGGDIKSVQKFLNDNGYTLASNGAGSPGQETDEYGGKTLAEVKAFQSANGLTPDGKVGPQTLAAMNSSIASTNAAAAQSVAASAPTAAPIIPAEVNNFQYPNPAAPGVVDASAYDFSYGPAVDSIVNSNVDQFGPSAAEVEAAGLGAANNNEDPFGPSASDLQNVNEWEPMAGSYMTETDAAALIVAYGNVDLVDMQKLEDAYGTNPPQLPDSQPGDTQAAGGPVTCEPGSDPNTCIPGGAAAPANPVTEEPTSPQKTEPPRVTPQQAAMNAMQNLKSTVTSAFSDYKLTQSEVNAMKQGMNNALQQSALTSGEKAQLQEGLNYLKNNSLESMNSGLSTAQMFGVNVTAKATVGINSALSRLRGK